MTAQNMTGDVLPGANGLPEISRMNLNLLTHDQQNIRDTQACRQMLWAMLDGERLSPLGLRVMTDLFTCLAGEAAELVMRGELPCLADNPMH